jgi:hypothetical protein
VGGAVDVAMVFLDGGFAVPRLDQSRYTHGTVNVYQGSASSLRGQMVRAMGYGPSFGGDTSRILRGALKTVTDPISTTWYSGVVRNNRGTSCPGDSGGPDFALTSPESVAGVHSNVDRSCSGGPDGNAAAAAWRDWAAQTSRRCLFSTASCPG